ncbi:uncharacterized protein RCC_08084 [Ramularia collo-cygni]|uniref:Protein kinase domain-containing protein n=1 Tax=Ramularia collo-cygni TaxID=112498 RepID=A0A2D3V690_9PEZI|nr:uncharacterized protein RCC_08084 [Ramularia collo-cygni]CZT22215.1 uncharacterized protein RCC_08084 [Ramularia collo-cygni]
MASLPASPLKTAADFAKRYQHYVLGQISTGSYAHAHFSLPKSIADQTLAVFDSHKIEHNEACRRLRASLQAIKICKGKTNGSADNMDLEITVLSHTAKKGHPNLVGIRDADAASTGKSWYTLELLTGDTFEKYCDLLYNLRLSLDRSPESFSPVSFGWHLVLQVTQGLLALHFGDKNGKECRSWPMYTHGDTHPKNLLFRGGTGQYKDYPDAVLIDFGRTQKLGSHTDRAAFFRAQHADVKLAIHFIVKTQWARDLDLRTICSEIWELDIQEGVDNNRILKSWMKDLRLRAFRERERLYIALHPDVIEHFQQEMISENELWEQTISYRSLCAEW